VIAAEPAADFFIVDRFLCAADLMGADGILVWNKSDIGQPQPQELALYSELGYPVICTSAADGSGLPDLEQQLGSGISMLVGQSGVGKSSLVNRLIEDASVLTGELSAASGEGRHTTTASFAHQLRNGGMLVDSPGIRDFAPAIDEAARVQNGFREIIAHADHCRFANCEHFREPGCAVKAAVANQEIAERRYESYRRLRNISARFIAQNRP